MTGYTVSLYGAPQQGLLSTTRELMVTWTELIRLLTVTGGRTVGLVGAAPVGLVAATVYPVPLMVSLPHIVKVSGMIREAGGSSSE
jgi:hypothetical protein